MKKIFYNPEDVELTLNGKRIEGYANAPVEWTVTNSVKCPWHLEDEEGRRHASPKELKYLAQASEWLDRIRYKPNVRVYWGYRRVFSMSGVIAFRFAAEVLDSISQDHNVTVTTSYDLNFQSIELMNFEHFYSFIYREILRLEKHETDEFFQVDGVPPFDPHKGEKK